MLQKKVACRGAARGLQGLDDRRLGLWRLHLIPTSGRALSVTDADAAALRSVLRDHLAATIELLDGEDRFYRKHIPQRLLAYLGRLPLSSASGPSDDAVAALPTAAAGRAPLCQTGNRKQAENRRDWSPRRSLPRQLPRPWPPDTGRATCRLRPPSQLSLNKISRTGRDADVIEGAPRRRDAGIDRGSSPRGETVCTYHKKPIGRHVERPPEGRDEGRVQATLHEDRLELPIDGDAPSPARQHRTAVSRP